MKRIISILISAVMAAGMFTAVSPEAFAATKKVSLKKTSATLKITEKKGKAVYGKTTIKVKKSKGVTVNRITFKSKNTKVAKVSKKGKVTARKSGNAKIKIKIKYTLKKRVYTKTLTFKVTVKDARAAKKTAAAPTVNPTESATKTQEAASESTSEQVAELTTVQSDPIDTVPVTTAEADTTAPVDTTSATEPGESIAETQDNTNDCIPSEASEPVPSESGDIPGDTGHCIVSDPSEYTEPETTQAVEPVEIRPETFEEKLSAFSNKLYALCAEEEDKNFVMSPVSVYMALSMLYSIGDDGVKSDLERFVGMSEAEFNRTGELFTKLVRTYSSYDWEHDKEVVDAQLNLSNSIWLRDDVEINEEVLKDFTEKLKAEGHTTTFSSDNEAANKEIQEFVKEKTNGLIDRNFGLSENTVLALINTLYFKDFWDSNFGMLYAKEGEFETPDGVESCEFLYGKYTTGQVYENENCEMFYSSTEHGYKIKFIMPKDGCSLDEVLTAANLYNLNKIRDFNGDVDGVTHKTYCIFPSFKIDCGAPLAAILKNNGELKNAFEGFYSDLTGEMPLSVSDIIHHTVVDVTRDGIEGAAVTIIPVEPTSGDFGETVYHQWKVNKSFGFIITDSNDTVLFEGKVLNPKLN